MPLRYQHPTRDLKVEPPAPRLTRSVLQSRPIPVPRSIHLSRSVGDILGRRTYTTYTTYIIIYHPSSITMFRTPLARASTRAAGYVARTQVRCASAHAISNPTLADIEKRWEDMPPQEQAELWMSLRDRMKINWAELTLQEKKAGM